MAYDEAMEERIGNMLRSKGASFEAKKMMGGLVFMVNEKMCMGVHKTQLMARIDPEDEAAALEKDGAEKMNFTGRTMKGFIFVDPEGVDMDSDLEYFVDLALKFNPKANKSKKKKKR